MLFFFRKKQKEMELLIKHYGSMTVKDAFAVSILSEYQIPTEISKLNIKQFFNSVIADDIDWMDINLRDKITDKNFLKDWMQEMSLRKPTTKSEPKEEKVIESIPLNKYEVNKTSFIDDELILIEDHLKHISTYKKHIPSAQITDILKPIFEKMGFVFTASNWELLWNVLLIFPNLQTAILDQYDIISAPNQAKAPKDIVGFGGLNDFLSMDLVFSKMKKKWDESTGFNNFSFVGRPWTFHMMQKQLTFEEKSNTSLSLFEQLLLFAHSKYALEKFTHPIFQLESKPKTVVLLCYYLCLSNLFGKQITMDPKFQPQLYYSVIPQTPIPTLHKYFLSIYSHRAISISLEHFKSNQMFASVPIDPLAHPLPQKTYLWIQQLDDEKYKIFIFPKMSVNSLPPIVQQLQFQSPDLLTRKIFSSKQNEVTFPVCKINSEVLHAINTVGGNVYKASTNEDIVMENLNIWLCFVEGNKDLKKVIYLAQIWQKEQTVNLIICKKDIALNGKNVLIMNKKMAIQEWPKIASTIGLVFFFDGTSLPQFFEPRPKYGYVIITSSQEDINWTHIQYLFSRRNPILKSISFAQAILDNCVVSVKISPFTLERENQEREYATLLSSELTSKLSVPSSAEISTTQTDKRHFGSRLLNWKKQKI